MYEYCAVVTRDSVIVQVDDYYYLVQSGSGPGRWRYAYILLDSGHGVDSEESRLARYFAPKDWQL